MAFRGAKGSVTIIDKATKPLRSIANHFKKLGDSTKKSNAELSKTQNAINGISKAQNRLNRVNTNVKRQTKDIGSQAVGIAALALSFKAALSPAIKFEQAMKDLESQAFGSADASVDVVGNMKKLSEQARKLGASTRYSATQAAEGQIFLAKAGFKTYDIISALPGLLDLAAASGTDLGRASDITSDLLGSFGMTAKETSRLADILSAATSSANVDMETLFETLKVAAPIGREYKATTEEIVTATALLGNVGIKGSMAGTALKNMYLNLAAPASTGAKVMKEVGISVADANGKMLPMQKVLLNLAKASKKLSTQKRIEVFDAVFGKIAMAGSLNLEKAVTSGDFNKMLKNLQNSEGIAKKMANIRMDSTEGSIVQLMSATEGLAIAFGSILTPMVRKFTEGITSITPKIQEFIANNGKTIEIIGIMAAALLVGKVAMLAYTATMWLVSPALTALSVALKIAKIGMIAFNLVVSLNPIGLIIIAITALIAAGVALYTNWEPISEFFSDLWETIEGLVDSFKELANLPSPLELGKQAFNMATSYFSGDETDQMKPAVAAQTIRSNAAQNNQANIMVNVVDNKVKSVETSGNFKTDVFLNESGRQF